MKESDFKVAHILEYVREKLEDYEQLCDATLQTELTYLLIASALQVVTEDVENGEFTQPYRSLRHLWNQAAQRVLFEGREEELSSRLRARDDSFVQACREEIRSNFSARIARATPGRRTNMRAANTPGAHNAAQSSLAPKESAFAAFNKGE
ncbi:MAG: hypothetical protein AAFP90_15975 [Planctomycetota bacterium]